MAAEVTITTGHKGAMGDSGAISIDADTYGQQTSMRVT